ncbi:MAG: DUF349 domain-containing protein [Bacteroidales bacterium]|jgi:hypothetical protein|nr:DUF349 domain-containing protein [Bacteroidales bacterium]MDY0197397.1 DUF349 domain-containing protein [Tenuifilaceae bacterium]
MESKNQKDPISNDQFGDAEATSNPTNNSEKPHNKLEDSNLTEELSETKVEESVPSLPEEQQEQKAVIEEPKPVVPEKKTPKAKTKAAPVEKVKAQEAEKVVFKDEPIDDEDELEEEEEEDEEDDKDDKDNEPRQQVDYSALTKDEMSNMLADLINTRPINRIRADVESIKINFYKKHKAENERRRKEWVDAGGVIEEYQAPEDMVEPQVKELLKQYRDKKSIYNRELENQKSKNLEVKQAIIEKIKDLVNRNESVNQTFQEFKELQQQWREIGPVPQASLNDLWETYHHHVQNFYDYVKINNELKDLDLKRNLEEKISLCEKAEELLLEPSVVNAFKKLQKHHNQWREIGPVPNENRSEIWERFKEVTTIINKKHQEHFENLREDQKSNLEAKKALCERAEDLGAKVINNAKEWNKLSKEMIELQKVWKTIGFAPKKDNNKIYERFRAACDTFFNSKREFYQDAREEQTSNLQLKTELCLQAEGLKESPEWKRTTEELINLQKRWKEIGPVPRKYSDVVWKRFRAACDYFFERKSQHFKKVDSKYEDNLKAKEQLIEEIVGFQVSDENVEESLKVLKEYQRRWAEIGFVPIKKKDELQKNYREAINKHFEGLKIDNSRKNILKFKTKIDSIQGNPKGDNKIRFERDKLFTQLKQIEGDITLWENNIGFFTKSKNAEQLIKDVERKIEKARNEMKVLEEKIRFIDSME